MYKLTHNLCVLFKQFLMKEILKNLEKGDKSQ